MKIVSSLPSLLWGVFPCVVLISCADLPLNESDPSTTPPVVKIEPSAKEGRLVGRSSDDGCPQAVGNLSIRYQQQRHWCGQVQRGRVTEKAPLTAMPYTARDLSAKASVTLESSSVALPKSFTGKVLRSPVRTAPVATRANSPTRSPSPAPQNVSVSTSPQFNYAVAYVYDNPAPWHAMWNRLSTLAEQDKWRGQNQARGTYFIYTGVYLNLHPAERRQQALTQKTGETPVIRQREG